MNKRVRESKVSRLMLRSFSVFVSVMAVFAVARCAAAAPAVTDPACNVAESVRIELPEVPTTSNISELYGCFARTQRNCVRCASGFCLALYWQKAVSRECLYASIGTPSYEEFMQRCMGAMIEYREDIPGLSLPYLVGQDLPCNPNPPPDNSGGLDNKDEDLV